MMRVWMLARDAGTESRHALRVLTALGYPVRSASSRVDVLPIEVEALVRHIGGLG